MVAGCLFMAISLLLIGVLLTNSIKILTGKYIIVVDELMDKKYYYDSDMDGRDYSGWLLYFKKYFKKYNEYIKIYKESWDESNKKGDKFYLVFPQGGKTPYIFKCTDYKLDESEKDKLKTLEEALKYINKKYLY